MRFLTVVSDLDLGGIQRGAQDYARGYAEHGHASAVLATARGGPREAAIRDASLPLFLGTEATREAAAWAPDVIHVHSWGPLLESDGVAVEEVLQHCRQRPVVIETTSFGKVDYGKRFDVTDVHFLLSRWALWRWRKWTRPFSPRPLGIVMPLTVDPATFYPDPGPFREQHGIPPGAVLLGSIARPDPIKWHPLLVDTATEVATQRPDVYLAFVGPSAEARARLAAAPADVVRRMRVLPVQARDAVLREAYSALDVFLHASPIGETFGLAFIESLACGTPVATVATPHKNNSQLEVVGHERGGLIAAGPRSYLANVLRLASDGPLRARLGRDGREHTLRSFTLPQVIPRVVEIAEALRQSPGRAAMAGALASHGGLTTDVSDADVRTLLSRTDGTVPLGRRMAQRLVHIPLVHRTMRTLRP